MATPRITVRAAASIGLLAVVALGCGSSQSQGTTDRSAVKRAELDLVGRRDLHGGTALDVRRQGRV